MDITRMGPEEIRSAVPMADAVAAVRDGFLALHRGEFEMPTRTGLCDGSTLATFAVGFAARPLGAIFLSPLGDRIASWRTTCASAPSRPPMTS